MPDSLNVQNTVNIKNIDQPVEGQQKGNVSYRRNDYERTPQADEVNFRGKEDNSNSGKFVGLGITALAIGSAIYAGLHGKKILKLVGNEGGLFKSIGKGYKNFFKGAERAARYTEAELKEIGNKKLSELTKQEFQKYLDTVIPADEPVMKKCMTMCLNLEKNPGNLSATLAESDIVNSCEYVRNILKDALGADALKQLLSKDSVLIKPIKNITIEDMLVCKDKIVESIGCDDKVVKEIVEVISKDSLAKKPISKIKMREVAKHFIDNSEKYSELGLNPEQVDLVKKSLDSNQSLIEFLKKTEEYEDFLKGMDIGKEIDASGSLLDVFGKKFTNFI